MNIDNLTKEQISWIADNCHCPKSSGFDGPDTFFGCGQCVICKCIDVNCTKDVSEAEK